MIVNIVYVQLLNTHFQRNSNEVSYGHGFVVLSPYLDQIGLRDMIHIYYTSIHLWTSVC